MNSLDFVIRARSWESRGSPFVFADPTFQLAQLTVFMKGSFSTNNDRNRHCHRCNQCNAFIEIFHTENTGKILWAS